MNQGYLRMLVLQQLSTGPSSGYALVKSIQQNTGWKPSYGSIYPLLERLETEHLAIVKDQGRSKVYSLSALGKARFSQEMARRKEAFTSIAEQLRVLASMGDEEAAQMAEIITKHAESDIPVQELPELSQMRSELHRLMLQGKFRTKTREIRGVASRATTALRKL